MVQPITEGVITIEGGVLQEQIQAFIRGFGLVDREHRTPCGQPIPTSQAHALQVLGQGAPLTQQMLAEELRLDKSTTSRLVSQLIDRGWVERSINPGDRREFLLTLTEQGMMVRNQVTRAAATKFEALWAVIPEEKKAQVLESLGLITDALNSVKQG